MTTAARIAERLSKKKPKPGQTSFVVPCPAHQDDRPSLALRDSESGKLLLCCHAGCAPAEIFAAIRRIDRGLLTPNDTAPQPSQGTFEYQRQQSEKARWMWGRRRPIVGSVAEIYLREVRKYAGPLPPTLAFLPPLKAKHQPAMVATFSLVDEPEPGVLGKPQDVGSVHLTLLKPDGSGKADVDKPKLIIGSPGGRPIVIAPPNDLLGLAICEGIEDALTAHAATGLGAWAAGSAGFMPKLANVVPDYIEAVTIFAHTDKAGQDGARTLAAALRKHGIEIRVEGL